MSEQVDTQKLTKKQRKALEFRKKKTGKAEEPQPSEEKSEALPEETTKTAEDGSTEPEKKKRKTRRGKKGKGLISSGGKRFILFVGNLPFNCGEKDLRTFFKNSKPDLIRLRQDKGIAFLEFQDSKDDAPASKDQNLRSRMDFALSKHHAIFQNRKINVELTAGGGGNSSNRMEKIKEKNLKLSEERKQKIIKNEEELKKKRKQKASGGDGSNEGGEAPSGIHPSRLALMNKQR